jgi:pyridoxal 5'-phosphate synthase pdxT subunit
MRIGVLALQGDYEAHRKILERCGVAQVVAVRESADLEKLDGLIIPGGESTVMSRLCDRYQLWEPLRERIQGGMGALGTCAGLILLSRNIEGATKNFSQKTLGLLDVDVARNAYGAQLDSFETDVALETGYSQSEEASMRAVFIRAPRIVRCGENVEVLIRHNSEPVAVRQGNIVASAFHPEIAGEARLHKLWLDTLNQN